MSCNGCRVLRKGCNENCTLRPCLQWIRSPESQGHATLFLAKFFGRAALMSFISNVPETQRPALFQSLLFEACGRTVSPVNGAVGLLGTGNWQLCQAAVKTVLQGGTLRSIPRVVHIDDTCSDISLLRPAGKNRATKTEQGNYLDDLSLSPGFEQIKMGLEKKRRRSGSPSEEEDQSGTSTYDDDQLGQECNFDQHRRRSSDHVKLLELFR